MFDAKFPSDPLSGCSISATQDGLVIVASIHVDDGDPTPPWEREEGHGHGPVSDWRDRDSKRPGERIVADDGDLCRFYDFAETCRIALRDNWGVECPSTMTPRQIAAEAARRDFERLKAWCNDEWRYVGVSVVVSHAETGVPLTKEYAHALWGLESDCPDHLTDTARDLAGEAIEDARATLAALQNAA